MHGVFVLSSGQVPILREAYGVDPRRTVVVPFGVDGDFFTPGDQSEVDPELVVSVGNDRDRDFPTVLRAFRSVRDTRPSSRLVIVSKTISQHEADAVPGVTVVPHLSHSELRDLVRRAAVTITLTRPNLHVSGITAVLETIAMGRPAITTDTPGMSDYVHAEGGIFTVPPGDHAAAAQMCSALLDDPDRASAVGRAGRRTLERHFTTERQAARLAPLLQDAVATG
nr:glycosyltransferase family 4 protein [Nocardioides flavescens]